MSQEELYQKAKELIDSLKSVTAGQESTIDDLVDNKNKMDDVLSSKDSIIADYKKQVKKLSEQAKLTTNERQEEKQALLDKNTALREERDLLRIDVSHLKEENLKLKELQKEVCCLKRKLCEMESSNQQRAESPVFLPMRNTLKKVLPKRARKQTQFLKPS